MIGVCLHEGRMLGKKFKKEKKRIERRNSNNSTLKNQRVTKLFMKLFWSNSKWSNN